MDGSAGELRVRRVSYRGATERDHGALHVVETEVERERHPDRTPQPLDRYVAFARSLPALFTDWTWLVETGRGEPVGQGACWYRAGGDPQVLECDVMVRRTWRGQGIGRRLLALVCDVAEAEGRRVLVGSTYDSAPDGERFARRVGARAGRISRNSELLLADVDWTMVERWRDDGRRRAPGYTLDTVEGPIPESLYGDAVVFHEIMNTQPQDDLERDPQVLTAEHVAQLNRSMAETGRDRWTIFVRDPRGACVGGTEVAFEPWEPTTVLQGDTGIHPDHRGRGLGKWAKAAMLLRLRSHLPAAERVRTGNAYSNAPMLAINDALGFEVVQSRTEWEADVAAVRAALVREDGRPGS